MSEFSYTTIKAPSEGVYKEKGSKFIAKAYPVNSEEEIKQIQADLRKEYYDARHHCYAYIYGKKGQHYRANDDGEPNHSAGDPILGQIRSKNLGNVLVVVIRYFGGTKLGVGGLISAYKIATKEALDNAVITTKDWKAQINIQTDYSKYNELMAMIKNNDGDIIDESYNNNDVFMSINISERHMSLFADYLQVSD